MPRLTITSALAPPRILSFSKIIRILTTLAGVLNIEHRSRKQTRRSEGGQSSLEAHDRHAS